MTRPIIRALVALSVAALCDGTGITEAQSAKRPAEFPLTDTNLAKYAKASDNLAAYMKQHPGEADLSGGNDSYHSADEAGKALCEPHPTVRQAITSAGLTCAQYIEFTMELEKTAGFASMAKAGGHVPAGLVPAEDIAFFQKHEPEVRRVLTEIGAGSEVQ
jgi:hypothetical protein